MSNTHVPFSFKTINPDPSGLSDDPAQKKASEKN